MKTFLKILVHVWFAGSIAICLIGGDFWAAATCAFWYTIVVS